jgi:hypothetical protein
MQNGIKFTDKEVKAWLNEYCPDLIVDEGWVYEGALTPIPGVCAACGKERSPALHNLKNHGQTHCASCIKRVLPEDVAEFAASHGHTDIEIFYAESYQARGNENVARIKLTCPDGHAVDMLLKNFRRSMRGNAAEQGGCKQCATGGFKDDLEGFVYLLTRDHAEFIRDNQIGITNDLQGRTYGYIKHGWTLIDHRRFASGADARAYESRIKRMQTGLGTVGSVPPDGYKLRSTEAWRTGSGLITVDNLKALDMALKIFEAKQLSEGENNGISKLAG